MIGQQPNPAPARSPLRYEPEMFREFLQDMDLSVAEQDALLDAVWLVIVGVIHIGLNPLRFVQTDTESKPLAIDSATMLALLSTSNSLNADNATATKPDAEGTDS